MCIYLYNSGYITHFSCPHIEQNSCSAYLKKIATINNMLKLLFQVF